MRDGTPSGLSTISTGVPSGMYGMSSSGRMRRDDALVAVASGHLVADTELALHGDVNLDHLDDARRKLVTLLQVFTTLLGFLLQHADAVLGALDEHADRLARLFLDRQRQQLAAGQAFTTFRA